MKQNNGRINIQYIRKTVGPLALPSWLKFIINKAFFSSVRWFRSFVLVLFFSSAIG